MKLIDAGDPYINHFAQADTIVPGAGSSQAWDRYAYAMNNPLRYIDPSGHEGCDPDDEECLSGHEDNGTFDSSACYKFSDGKCYETEHLYQMLLFALLAHADTLYLVGNAIDQLRNDPELLGFQGEIVARALVDPRYKQSNFWFSTGVRSVTFGGERDTTNMGLQLADPLNPEYSDTWDVAKNELTWMVRAAEVNAYTTVNTNGEITINYSLHDTFDLKPDWINKELPYNLATSMLGGVWHDLLGASAPDIYANWTTTLNPWQQ